MKGVQCSRVRISETHKISFTIYSLLASFKTRESNSLKEDERLMNLFLKGRIDVS